MTLLLPLTFIITAILFAVFLVYILAAITSKPIPPKPLHQLPNISIVIPAYNEESVIEDRINNLTEIYPKDKMELIISNEGSLDNTEEIATNAISHRDYESSSKVQVRIFDDRIEFWNPGRLPDGWTTKTLKQIHESVPTNPAIAKQFFWVKYIEEVGTGTNKIIEKCFDWGLPEPEFKCTGTSLVVTLWKTKLTDEYLAALDLNERQRKIINYLKKNNRITSKECAELFSITERTARRDLRSLVDEKILIQTGTGKKSTYYELTV